jgi:hypothetical protein
MGHFSFDRPPAKWFENVNGRTVLVSKQIAISGTTDENGDMTTIDGGDTTPNWAGEAFGVWKLDPARSTLAGNQRSIIATNRTTHPR